MSAPVAHRFHVVVAVDLSEYSDIVLERAFDLAARHDACDIHAIVVHEDASRIAETKQRLTALVGDAASTFRASERDWRIRLHARTGDAVEQIAALAGEVIADVIVIGRFGLHPARGRLGGVAERMLQQAPCSTLVVQLKDHVVEAHAQCPACVEVRRATRGENWFCGAHHSDERAWFHPLW